MIVKQAIDVSFARGLDTKTDPKRRGIGLFSMLRNTIFTRIGELQKRNGYRKLTALPDNSSSYLTTLNENLTAIGTSIAAYNSTNASWVSKGSIEPLSLDTLPLIRNNLNQTTVDAAVSSTGLVCTAYLEYNGSTTVNKYAIADAVTGQNIVAPIAIPVSSGTVSGGMRVFTLGNYFIIVFTNTITGTAHLQYIAISINIPTSVSANTDIASVYITATTLSWDGFVSGSRLYIAYNTTSGGQSIKVTSLSQSLSLTTAVTFAGRKATMMSVTADETNPASPVIYASFYDSAGSTGYTLAVDQNLNTLLAPTQIIATGTYLNITSAAQNGVCRVFAEVSNAYAWASGIKTNYINTCTVTLATATVSALVVSIRSVGLASKAFIIAGTIYYLSAYSSPYQPTYFLINGTESLSSSPVISAKLAYTNGGGYLTLGLPSVTVEDNIAYIAYLFKDLIQAVNKDTNVASGTQTAGVYSQTGINLSKFEIGTQTLDTAEIAKDLHLTGGFLWLYDGYLPVEHNFFLWPDTDTTTPANTATWSATGGSMVAKPDGATNTNAYFYQITYEWSDNQGNIYRSSPSIPIPVTTTGSGTAGSVVINVATLRLSYKVANPVKIVIYRWSVAQQAYYQVTSVTAPTLNSTTVDTVIFTDTLADASIIGNNLIYTTGGVLEDINAPGSDAVSLFDDRLWMIDAEDKNLLWHSKQVIEATPVEMSDLLTIYVPPSTGTEGTTGPLKCHCPMDDKLILFKNNAILYINGTGPDNTGANSQYSQPIFVTSTVGCANQKSIVFMPQGLMFQSNKGIWLLDRSLGTSYIGAPVEEFNDATVLAAQSIPGTNQVRFVLDSGITLVYDYYYNEWGTFTGVPGISACIFEDLHTFIDSYGRTYQESVGSYLDGSNPVLIAFKTGPLRLGDLQNYQRAYFFYLMGTYFSPHKLQVLVFYDYSDNPSQSDLLTPINYSPPYGSGASQSPYGQGATYGGSEKLEQFRVFLERQRCQAFAIQVEEIYDGSYSVPAGQGLSLSGINLVMALKGRFPTLPSNISFG